MLLQLPFLKTAILWLTTAVSLCAVFPQFQCVCPNGSQRTQFVFANGRCGCAKEAPVVSAPAETTCPLCRAEKPRIPTSEGGANCSETPCVKSKVEAVTAVVPTAADPLDAIPSAPAASLFELSFHVAHAPTFYRSTPLNLLLSSPDLVALGHLLI